MARLELLTISVIALILAISLPQAFSLKCYECNSNDLNNQKCDAPGDELSGDLLKDCNSAYQSPVCLKIDSGATKLVKRTCGENKAAADKACSEVQAHDKDAFCGQCQSDKCNGASAQYGSAAAAVLIVVPIAIMKILSF